jgi:hypothetical protein
MAKKSKAVVAEQPTFVTTSSLDQTTTESSFNISTQAGLEAWIYWQYRHHAFYPNGNYKGLKWLKSYLVSLNTGRSATKMRQALQP